MKDFGSVKVRFPAYRNDGKWKFKHRYYHDYFLFILNVFKDAGCSVEEYMPPDDIPNWGNPDVEVNGKRCVFDIYDSLMPMKFTAQQLDGIHSIFKNHWFESRCKSLRDLYPDHSIFNFCPQSFVDWDLYRSTSKLSRDGTNPGDFIWKMRYHAKRKERSRGLPAVVNSGKWRFDTGFEKRDSFLAKCRRSSGVLLVPGVNSEVLDKAHLQCFGIGSPIISSEIRAELPWGVGFKPGEDYYAVKDDYSDLEEALDWMQRNENAREAMAQSCARKFSQGCTPSRLVSWILKCIEESK